MAYLDEDGMTALWNQVDAIFARLTEAGGSITFDGSNLALISCSNAQLGTSIPLANTFAKRNQAVGSLRISGKTLYYDDVNGNNINYVTLP